MPAPVAGVDGCRSGWVVASGPAGAGAPERVEVVAAIHPVVARAANGELAAVAVDMPIGLPDHGPRACDVQARRHLGPRRSSVFPAPRRGLLGCTDWAGVSGISRQAFNLLAKLGELDRVITPAAQQRVVEAHPELAFARLAGAPMAHPKRTRPGRAERLAALGLDPASPLVGPLRGAAPDDVLDAIALWHTARHRLAGTATPLGDGARDGRGLRMEIVW